MNEPTRGAATTVIKPRTSAWFTWLAFVLVAAGLVSTIVTDGWAGLLLAWPLIAIAYVAWWLFWYPAVLVGPDGVTLRNPVRTVCIPWAALIHVDTKYALQLVTPGGSYTAWAAPAPGVWGTHAGRVEHLSNLPATSYGPGRSVRPGDLKNTDSGYAALLVRSYWQTLVDGGSIDADQTALAEATTRVTWLLTAVAVVLVAAGGASLALT